MEARGKIHKIGETQTIGASGFRKRELVLVYGDNPMYPNYVVFEFTQDRTPMLDSFRPGEEVEVRFDLSGREWTSPQGEVKYFNSLRAFDLKRIELVSPTGGGYAQAQGGGNYAPTPPPATRQANDGNFAADETDDLPF